MNSKTISSLLFLILFLLLMNSCDTPSNTSSGVMVKVASFSFTSANTASPKSQDVSFVLINPRYAVDFAYKNYSPFSDFAKAMAKDAEQTIISRGFSIFGPYESPDVMVYSDKKNSDMTLEISIAPEVNWQNVAVKSHFVYGLAGTSYTNYSFEGTVVLSGKIDMTLRAVWNQEKLWVKSIPLEEKTFTIASTKRYEDNEVVRAFIQNDAGVINPFVDALQAYYTVSMQTIYSHLDLDEMKQVKAQADEIKAKYQK